MNTLLALIARARLILIVEEMRVLIQQRANDTGSTCRSTGVSQ